VLRVGAHYNSAVIRTSYRALLLDLDGTLVSDAGVIRPRTLDALRAAHARGARVMIATGRSEGGTRPVLEELAYDTPAIVFNGAGLYCPLQWRLVEERVLAGRTAARVLAHARRAGLYPVVMRYGEKLAPPPRTPQEESALAQMEDLRFVAESELSTEHLMRVTLFSAHHADSEAMMREVEAVIERPAYLTHFPLRALAAHRSSPLMVVDVQPPCRGKAEGLRVLRERYGIAPEHVVAVGDAENDLPMLRAAGLGVAMENAMSCAREAAARVIGDNNGDSLAELVVELFPA
jgi:Cof subfamily protein (haloacid dehalogenase superfamily)